MKKRSWKRALALGLVFAMTLGAAGCQKKDGGKKGGNVAADPALAKQNVYRYQEVDLGMGKKGDKEDFDMSVLSSLVSDETIYLLANEWGYDSEKSEYASKLVFYRMKKDGSDLKSISLEAPKSSKDTSEQDNQTQDGSDTQTDSTASPAQGARKISGLASSVARPVSEAPESSADDASQETGDADQGDEAEDAGEVTADFLKPIEIGVEDDYQQEDYFYENNDYSLAVIGKDAVYACRRYSRSSFVDGEYTDEQSFYIDCWDLQGKLLWESPIDISKYQNEDTYSYVNYMIGLSDGRIGLMMGGDQTGIIYISNDGAVSDLKKLSGEKDISDRQGGSVVCGDGSLLISYYDEEWKNQFLISYDPLKDTYGTEYKVPDEARANGFNGFTSVNGKDIYFSNNSGVYRFALGDTEIVKVMDYINSDLLTYSLQNLLILDDNSFLGSYYDPVDYQQHLCLFSYVKPEDVQEKKVLVYAGYYVDSEMKKRIIDFNKTNPDYRITVKDYSMYRTTDDYRAGYTKLNNDIIVGNVPDILDLNDEMPVDSYISKGLLADIDELIKNDPELSQIEFVDNVFDTYRINGKLYRVIPKFSVRTFIGKKSLFGDRSSITMEELNQIASGQSGETSIFGLMYTRENFLRAIMQFGGGDFVDVKSGKCNFDTPLFVSLLEFAKKLPTDDQQWGDGYDEEFWMEYYQNYESQYRENRTLLMECNLYNLTSMKSGINGTFGEDITYVGFPTESGEGSSVQALSSYAIYANSANLEGAWEFLRYYLTDEYQKGDEKNYYVWGLPVNKAVLRQQADQTMQKSFYIDYETGEKVESEEYFWINGEQFPLQPLSQEQADQLFNFVCSINKSGYYSEEVNTIISEEVQAFFQGQKSAKDAATNIQKRVQLYVDENK